MVNILTLMINKFSSLRKRKVFMPKYLVLSLSIVLFCVSNTSFTMKKHLMLRNNAGKTDSADIEEIKEEKNFSNRTIKDIQEEQCSLCLEKLNKSEITIPICGHSVHTFCFEKLKKNNYRACGICKNPFEHYNEIDEEQETDCCIAFISETADVTTEKIQELKIRAINRILAIKNQPLTWQKLKETTNFVLNDHRDVRLDY